MRSRKIGVEGLQHDLDGVRVHDLDGLDHLEVDAEARARRSVDLPLEAELDVLGGQLAEALVELHALPELERPHRAVRRERPALGEVRLDLGGGHLAVLDREAREAAVHEALDGLGLPEDARVRIEGVGLLGRDVEDLLLLGQRRGRRGQATSRPGRRSGGPQSGDGPEREPASGEARHGCPPCVESVTAGRRRSRRAAGRRRDRGPRADQDRVGHQRPPADRWGASPRAAGRRAGTPRHPPGSGCRQG